MGLKDAWDSFLQSKENNKKKVKDNTHDNKKKIQAEGK